jgi:hypothetical protein
MIYFIVGAFYAATSDLHCNKANVTNFDSSTTRISLFDDVENSQFSQFFNKLLTRTFIRRVKNDEKIECKIYIFDSDQLFKIKVFMNYDSSQMSNEDLELSFVCRDKIHNIYFNAGRVLKGLIVEVANVFKYNNTSFKINLEVEGELTAKKLVNHSLIYGLKDNVISKIPAQDRFIWYSISNVSEFALNVIKLASPLELFKEFIIVLMFRCYDDEESLFFCTSKPFTFDEMLKVSRGDLCGERRYVQS